MNLLNPSLEQDRWGFEQTETEFLALLILLTQLQGKVLTYILIKI